MTIAVLRRGAMGMLTTAVLKSCLSGVTTAMLESIKGLPTPPAGRKP